MTKDISHLLGEAGGKFAVAFVGTAIATGLVYLLVAWLLEPATVFEHIVMTLLILIYAQGARSRGSKGE